MTFELGNPILKQRWDLKENQRFEIDCFTVKNELKKIFHRFYRVDKSRNSKIEGTGLGLSISMKIINLMGSKIKLISQENIGSKFYFDIELEYFKDTSNTLVNNNFKDTPLKNSFQGSVLVAEDNNNNQFLIRTLLEEYGLNVVRTSHYPHSVNFIKKCDWDKE